MNILDLDMSMNDKVLYLLSKDVAINKLLELLSESQKSYLSELNRLSNKFVESTTVEWLSVSSVANDKGLSSDAVRKQLQNGDFEEGVDFKYKGARIQIHQGAIERIQRRRSFNG